MLPTCRAVALAKAEALVVLIRANWCNLWKIIFWFLFIPHKGSQGLTSVQQCSQDFRQVADPNLATQSAAASAKQKPQRRRTSSRLTRSFSIVKEHAGISPHTLAIISPVGTIPLFARRIKKCPIPEKSENT
jgi:hypothetical protein